MTALGEGADMNMRQTPVTGPAVWRGEDLQNSDEWIVPLTEADCDEIERGLAGVADIPAERIAQGDVPFPGLEERFREVAATLQDGRGFVLLRGLPVPDRFDDDQAAKVFCAIGYYLGTPVSQSRRGELIGHLQNLGQPGAFQRRFATSEATAFHNDRTDIVGLMCLRPARFGGESLLVSTMTLYNVVLQEHPEYLPILYKPFAKDLMGEQRPGEPGWEMLPLFCYESGYLSGTTSTSWFIRAMRFPEVPRLSAEEMSCFLFLESLPTRPGLSLSMTLEPGDIQFANNFTIMHTRTSFADDPDDPSRQRHLLRLWLSHFAGGRPICEPFANGRSGLLPAQRAA
jgi:Taurine catabolism dioxygenase TauD, TfdA family